MCISTTPFFYLFITELQSSSDLIYVHSLQIQHLNDITEVRH